MPHHSRHLLVVCCLLAALFASGCASLCSTAPGTGRIAAEEPSPPREGWWSVRFKIYWPNVSEEPSWYVDSLLADRVVGPLIPRFRKNLTFWRFHRRAADDTAGHQFSLIFYSTPKTADRIYERIRKDPLLKVMQARGLIVAVGFDDTEKIAKPGIEDMSDRHWSPTLQKSWPHFIMGVSEMWLDLVHRIALEETGAGEDASLETIQEHFKKIDTRVEDLWRKEGGHALLHHLNAIFGYEPVAVRGKGLLTF